MFQLTISQFMRALVLGSVMLQMAGVALTAQRTLPQTENDITRPTRVPSGFGATPIFNEEFNESSLDQSVWTYRGEGTQRDDCLIDASAVKVTNGFARISIYTAPNAQGKQVNYCGAITTQNGSFLHTYGYWEARVRFHWQQGIQCAFWLQSPTIGTFPGDPQQSGVEIDIFEHNNSVESATAYDHAVLWNGYKKYGQHVDHFATQEDLNDDKFHVAGLAWTPGTLTFYLDGQKTWTLNASDSAISDVAEYIIFDTELPNANNVPEQGFGALGSPNNAFLDVDYVRVYPYNTH